MSDYKETNEIDTEFNPFSNNFKPNDESNIKFNNIVLEEGYEFVLNGFKPNLNKYTVEEVLNALDGFNLIKPVETLKFILYNNALDYIQEAKPFLSKYYPNKEYNLEFFIDPEFVDLSCLVLSVNGITTPFEDNLPIYNKINYELRHSNLCNKKFIKNFSLEVF